MKQKSSHGLKSMTIGLLLSLMVVFLYLTNDIEAATITYKTTRADDIPPLNHYDLTYKISGLTDGTNFRVETTEGISILSDYNLNDNSLIFTTNETDFNLLIDNVVAPENLSTSLTTEYTPHKYNKSWIWSLGFDDNVYFENAANYISNLAENGDPDYTGSFFFITNSPYLFEGGIQLTEEEVNTFAQDGWGIGVHNSNNGCDVGTSDLLDAYSDINDIMTINDFNITSFAAPCFKADYISEFAKIAYNKNYPNNNRSTLLFNEQGGSSGYPHIIVNEGISSNYTQTSTSSYTGENVTLTANPLQYGSGTWTSADGLITEEISFPIIARNTEVQYDYDTVKERFDWYSQNAINGTRNLWNVEVEHGADDSSNTPSGVDADIKDVIDYFHNNYGSGGTNEAMMMSSAQVYDYYLLSRNSETVITEIDGTPEGNSDSDTFWGNQFKIGYAGNDASVIVSGFPNVDITYQYLSAGYESGWSQWSVPWGEVGDFALWQMEDRHNNGVGTTVFTYYNFIQSPPGNCHTGSCESAAFTSNSTNATTMRNYYKDFKLLMDKVYEFQDDLTDTSDHKVIIHIEPDLWGVLQQHSTENDPTTSPILVGSSVQGDADLVQAGIHNFPDNAAGFAQAFNAIRDEYALDPDNVKLAWHSSTWGNPTWNTTGVGLLNEVDNTNTIRTMANENITFYEGLGVDFDYIFFEFRDRDANYYELVYGWTDDAFYDQSDLNSFAEDYIGQITNATGEKGIIWQIPLGNSTSPDNDTDGYKDNLVENFLPYTDASAAAIGTYSNIELFRDNGVIGLLFGAGAGAQTTADNDGGEFFNRANLYEGNPVDINTPANAIPNSSLSASAGPYVINSAITFSVEGSDSDGSIANYEIDFGDGNSDLNTDGSNFTHSYLTQGAYTVTLTVTDDDGATSSDTITVIVNVAGATPSIEITNYSGVIGKTIGIFGSDFGTSQGSVTILGQNASIVDWSENYVEIIVPNVSDGQGQLVITHLNGNSSSWEFEVYTINPSFTQAPSYLKNVIFDKQANLQNETSGSYCFDQTNGNTSLYASEFLTNYRCGYQGHTDTGEAVFNADSSFGMEAIIAVDVEEPIDGEAYFKFVTDPSWYVGSGNVPADYVLEVSANTTNGTNGDWTEIESITGNTRGHRFHKITIPSGNYTWFRMKVINGSSDFDSSATGLDFRIKEIQLLKDYTNSATLSPRSDTMAIYGDSISADALRSTGVYGIDGYFDTERGADNDFLLLPAGLSGRKVAGIPNSGDEVSLYDLFDMDQNEAEIRYWGIALGTNDSQTIYDSNNVENILDTHINYMVNQGMVPIIARIPDTDESLGGYGDIETKKIIIKAIDEMSAKYKLIPGPDFYLDFRLNLEYETNPDNTYFRGDGTHHSNDGKARWLDMWVETLDTYLPTPNLSGLNTNPTALLTSDVNSGTSPLTITFDGGGSFDSDAGDSITNYSITFGDGGSDSNTTGDPFDPHTYTSAGTYTATLTVTDNNGGTNTATQAITVTEDTSNQAPTASLSADPTTLIAGESVTFTISGSSDPDDGIETYSIDYGDGNSNSKSSNTDFNHTYSTAGSYTATLTVTDYAGDSDSDTVNITVNSVPNQSPTADLTADSTDIEEGDEIVFTISGSSDPDDGIKTYSIDYGDGNSNSKSSNTDFNHTYSTAGSYTATLTVTDYTGDSDSDTVTITVSSTDNNTNPVAELTADKTSGNISLLVNFDGSDSYDNDTDDSIINYVIDFGDGSIEESNTTGTFTHVYTTVGTYTATLTVTDQNFNTNRTSINITVNRSSSGGGGSSSPSEPSPIPNICDSYSFPDVCEHSLREFIQNLHDRGIVKGFSTNEYRPDDYVTRAQMATFVRKTFNFEVNILGNCFSDVQSNNPHFNDIQTLCTHGVIQGYSDGSFRPDAPVKRDEATKFIVSSMLKVGIDTTPSGIHGFPDVTNTSPFGDYISFLTEVKVEDSIAINGYSNGYFGPKDNITRGQMAKIIDISIKYTENTL